MKVKEFIADNISFDEGISLNKSTKFFNALGNLLLSPARHLWQGKSVRCVEVPVDDIYTQSFFGMIDDRVPTGLERVVKTIISVLLFIPGTILGATFKGAALAGSDKLKHRYLSLANKHLQKEENLKIAGAVAICLYKKEATQLLGILKNLKAEGKLDSFIKYFAKDGGNLAYLNDYWYLYRMTEIRREKDQIAAGRKTRRLIDLPTEHVIGCFLKLFADEKIEPSKFFEKMHHLDWCADENEKQVNPNPIQKVIDLKDDLTTMTNKVEDYLNTKNPY